MLATLLATLLSVVVPVFVVIAAGGLLGRLLRPDLSTLNRVALYGAIPALVFTSTSQSTLDSGSVLVLFAGGALYLVFALALSCLVTPRVEARSRRGFIATSLYGNSANMMLPITLFAFGHEGLERALVLYILSVTVLFVTGPLVLAGGAERPSFRRVLRLPVVWAALSGAAFNLSELAVPLGLSRGLTLLGEAAIPLVLLSLGVQMQVAGVPLPSALNLGAAGFKLLVGPLLGYGAGWLVGARGLDLAVLTLLAAMSPAVNVFMLALEFGGKAEEVARTVVLATSLSLLTLSLLVWLLLRLD